jgi:hypothetical protein
MPPAMTHGSLEPNINGPCLSTHLPPFPVPDASPDYRFKMPYPTNSDCYSRHSTASNNAGAINHPPHWGQGEVLLWPNEGGVLTWEVYENNTD